jgi:hypothetical protein
MSVAGCELGGYFAISPRYITEGCSINLVPHVIEIQHEIKWQLLCCTEVMVNLERRSPAH